jgi:hypothetical protein
MRDTLDRVRPRFLRKLTTKRNWAVKVREIDSDAPVHPSVAERFDLPSVVQCAGSGPYRPLAVAKHKRFKHYYAGSGDPIAAGNTSTAPGAG